MKARDFDEAFDAGDDVSQHLDLSRAIRPNREIKRVNVDFPQWMVSALDDEAHRIGVTRQSVIKMWIAQRLDEQGRLSDEGSRSISAQ